MAGEDEGIHIIPKDLNSKVNDIARQKFEIAYVNVAVQLLYIGLRPGRAVKIGNAPL